jgi:osmoprotectant transport system substrate-binding protein
MRKGRIIGRRALVVLAALGMVIGTTAASAGAQSGKSITVGSKDFSGAEVLSEIWGQALAKTGDDVTAKNSIGPTEVVFEALKNGDIDAYADYQGTLLTYLGGTPSGDSAENYAALQTALEGTGVVASKPAPAVDVNGFYVTKATAKKYKLKNVSDLKKVADKLVFGGPAECQERDLCLGTVSQGLYGLDFKEVKKLDPGGPITVSALEDGDIDVALLFTGSSVIPKNAVLLADDKGLQPADNPVFLVREGDASKSLLKTVNKVGAKITTAAYNKASLAVSEDKEDPADVAAAFLKQNKLP